MKTNNGVIITGGNVNATNIAGTINSLDSASTPSKERRNELTDFQFDIGLSFAGEDRSFVEMLFKLLKKANIKVFYDQEQSSQLIGKTYILT